MTKTEPRSAGSGGGREKTQPTPTELLACWALVGGIETISPGAFKGRLFDSKEAAEQWRSETINPGVWRVVEMRETTAPSDQDIESLALALQPRGYFANSQHKDDEIARVRSALSSFSLATTLSAREDGWLPIETAPKDGTRIIVDFGSRVGIVTCAWEESVSGSEIWCVDDFKFGPYAIRGYVDEDIIGWQPLPAPKAPTAAPLPTFDGGLEVGATSHGKAPTAGEGDDETLWTVYKTMLHWVPFVGREAAILKVREAISQPKASAEGEPT